MYYPNVDESVSGEVIVSIIYKYTFLTAHNQHLFSGGGHTNRDHDQWASGGCVSFCVL